MVQLVMVERPTEEAAFNIINNDDILSMILNSPRPTVGAALSRDVCDISVKEAATIFGVSESSVRKHKESRAKFHMGCRILKEIGYRSIRDYF